MPKFLSEKNITLLGERIAEYVIEVKLEKILIILHGGEPLLAGIEKIQNVINTIQKSLPINVQLDVSIQTNGVLLSEKTLNLFEQMNVSVALSLDGPKEVHDLHRLTHKGTTSHQKVEKGLRLLEKRPNIFSGVIAVIDPNSKPRELLEYFSQFNIPRLDFLLPDANYQNPPPGRNATPNIYSDWLIELYNIWFNEYPNLRIRSFDNILESLVGLPSKTDAFGYGEVSLLTIETDGSYHDLDVLKIVSNNATNLEVGGLGNASIIDVLGSKRIHEHNKLLKKEGLSSTCQSCEIVDICGGGSLPHRFGNNTYDNPSIYCKELFTLINNAKSKLNNELSIEIATTASKKENHTLIDQEDLQLFENQQHSYTVVQNLLDEWQTKELIQLQKTLYWISNNNQKLKNVVDQILNLPEITLKKISTEPSVICWNNVISKSIEGTSVSSIDGKALPADCTYVHTILSYAYSDQNTYRVQNADFWVRAPFGEKIHFENANPPKYEEVLNNAMKIIENWDSDLYKEIHLLIRDILFIKDHTAHPDKIVSFSDNTVPGAIYVTIQQKNSLINAYDLADSIIHEFRHQRLYLLQKKSDIILIDLPLVQSPWREELRPPSGLFHALYVFTYLCTFWEHVSITATDLMQRKYAQQETISIRKKVALGFRTIESINLSQTGKKLLEVMKSQYAYSTSV